MRKYFLVSTNHFNLANLFSFVNIVMGLIAIYLISKNIFFWAIILTWIGGVCDIIDGKIARRLNLSSEFGIQVDSFADFISFVLVPSFLLFQAIFTNQVDIPLWFYTPFFIFYIISGLRRLIQFNINTNTGKVDKYFVGVPTPLGAIFLWLVYLISTNNILTNGYIILLLIVGIAYLLNSKVKIIHL